MHQITVTILLDVDEFYSSEAYHGWEVCKLLVGLDNKKLAILLTKDNIINQQTRTTHAFAFGRACFKNNVFAWDLGGWLWASFCFYRWPHTQHHLDQENLICIYFQQTIYIIMQLRQHPFHGGGINIFWNSTHNMF